MRLTVMGALLIVAAVIGVVLVVHALNERKRPDAGEGQSL
jgi:hypothetical protein